MSPSDTGVALEPAAIALRPRHEPRFSASAVFAYAVLHLGCLGVFYTGVTGEAIAVLCGAFLMRAFGVSIIFHRYFAHRSFRTSRVLQFLFGLYGTMTVLGGPLWWAQTHREHHRHADTRDDIHSPHYHGFIYAHCGWFLDHAHRDVDLSKIRDLARYPEIAWLERWSAAFKLLYIACAYWWFGVVGIVWGFFVPAVIVLQMVHWIQSVSHSIGGYRRYPTADDSRNHWLFGVLSFGEGFHHNHHCFPGSARLGLRWWEIDIGYYVLLGLSRLGLVWDVRVPSAEAYRGIDERAERQVARMRRELHGLADQLDGILKASADETDDRAIARDAHARLMRRISARNEAFLGGMKRLLVAGPFVLQRAEQELKRALLDDARAAFAASPDNARTGTLIERIGAVIAGEEGRRAAVAGLSR